MEFDNKENYNTKYLDNDAAWGDWVNCTDCGFIGVVEAQEDVCPECGKLGTLMWEDENKKEVHFYE